MWCLGECPSLVELTLDGNPLTDEPSYRHTVLASSSKIKMLDGKRTTVRQHTQNVLADGNTAVTVTYRAF